MDHNHYLRSCPTIDGQIITIIWRRKNSLSHEFESQNYLLVSGFIKQQISGIRPQLQRPFDEGLSIRSILLNDKYACR